MYKVLCYIFYSFTTLTKKSLYYFAIDTLRNCHKFWEWKNTNLLYYSSIGQKFDRGLTGPQPKCWRSCTFSGDSIWDSLPWTPPASGIYPYSLVHGSINPSSKVAMLYLSDHSFIVTFPPNSDLGQKRFSLLRIYVIRLASFG